MHFRGTYTLFDFFGTTILNSSCFGCFLGSTPTLALLVAVPATLIAEH